MEEFFNALSMESDGFYPFGVNEFWHGGVHITNQSNGVLKQGDGIQCIAEGEVVAYRINEKHIDTPAYEDPTKGTSMNIPYSSSFTLVRHTLEYPKDNKLAVFSLYMHLLPWNGYVQANTTPTQYRIKAANMRKVDQNKIVKGKTGVIKYLPAGVIVELSGKKKGNYREVSKIVSGISPVPAQLGWIYKTTYSKIKHSEPEGKKAPAYLSKIVYKVKNTANDTEAFAQGVKGVRGRIGAGGGEVLALYPRGSELELEAFAKGAKRAKVINVLSGTPSQQTGKTEKGYVWLADLEASTTPPEFDKVIIPSKPKPIKKGEKIGYMGQYCTPEKPTERPMLHWEVFAGDALNVFITKARAHNAKAKKSEKTVLKIPKGTPLISPYEAQTDTTIAKDSVVTTLKSQGEYKQLQTVGISKKVPRSLLGAWSSTNKVYTPKKESYKTLSTLLGITVNKSTRLSLLTQYKDGNRGILIPAQKSDTVWVKKTSKLTKLNTLKSQVATTTNAWKKYPEEFTHEILKISEDRCMTASELKTKKHDEYNNEWFEIASYDNQTCSVGYINASNLKYHAPAEFICFDGVDAPGGNDASIHKEPDNYWKNLFAPITLESSQHEEGSPVSDFRLDLQPFAKKVFQYMDENHDGKITLSEVQNAQKDPIKQKKIAKLITKHESEWVKSLDRWKYIEKYIPDATRYDWEHEKARIKKLAWWDDVKGKVTGFPSGDAFYFHPAGFVGNLMGGDCEITSAQLSEISGNHLGDKYVNYLNTGRELFGIMSCHDFGHFLAQIIHESGDFVYTKEYGGSTYLKAKKYWPYYGRGLMQLTWKKNYLSYGASVGENFTSSDSARDKVTLPEHAVKSAFWYWQTRGLSKYGEVDDFIWITIKVNGGLNGYNDRLKKLNKFKKEMSNDKISGSYAFSDSKAYNSLRGAYAWGLWNDPGKKKDGRTRNKVDAKAGYYRTLELLKAGKTVTTDIYGNKTTEALKKWATAHLKRLGGTPP